jgi:hypothetical protein
MFGKIQKKKNERMYCDSGSELDCPRYHTCPYVQFAQVRKIESKQFNPSMDIETAQKRADFGVHNIVWSYGNKVYLCKSCNDKNLNLKDLFD